MNWTSLQVTDSELQSLIKHNEPIPVSRGQLNANVGVDVYSISNRVNAIYDADLGAIRKLNGFNPQFKSMPNRDLLLYNDLLLNPKVNTIVVDGFFGTAKTSTVCSHLVPGLMEGLKGKGGIKSAYISKPHESVGQSYGHLPGDLDEKTAKEFQSYFQYFDRFGQPFLADILRGKKQQGEKPIPPMLEVMVFEYLRGRDIIEGWVVLDESQNTSRKDMATFISRVGDNAKMILLGDTTPTQIDKKCNTPENNGLTFAKETFADKKYAGAVEMQTIDHIIRGKRVRDLYVSLKRGA